MPPEPGQEPVSPLAAVELLDALGHRLQPAATLGQIELERRPQRLDHAVDVPRVDEHRPGQHLRRARELREEQRATPAPRKPRLRLAEDELVRDEVHPVAERRHHHHVRPPVERDEPLLRDVAVEVLDRRDPGLSVAAVDAGDQELDLVTLLAELGALQARGHEHLQHRGRLGAAGILLEESFEGEQLARDPLRVVEPLDPEHELASRVLLLELGEEPRGLGILEGRAKPRNVDPDRVDADARPSARRPRSSPGVESMPMMRRHEERKWRA